MKKIGFLGPKGTYTELALNLYLDGSLDGRGDYEILPLPSIDAVFQAIAEGNTDLGFVPVENIIQGPVTQTLDNLLRYSPKLKISGATILPIEHALGALPARGKIKRILSKDTALEQCSIYLNENYPGAEQVQVNSTSEAMRLIGEKSMDDAAAIGMGSSFQRYGLEVIARNVGNVKNNKTRFIVLGQEKSVPTGRDITSLAIYPRRDRVGLLDDILKIVSKEHGINMSSLHSRPDGKGLSKFYMDLEGHISDDNLKKCIAELQSQFSEKELFVFGSYPHLPFNEPSIKTIGIIGGTGKMGGWFKAFYESRGYKVLVSGRNTELAYEDCVKNSDAVIINVPIEYTEEIIRKIGPMMKKGQLLVDNTGVKTMPVRAMLENTSSDVEVLSIHTMFGQKTKNVLGENIISISTEKTKDMAEEFENIFYKHGAQITRTTPDDHDKRVALTQGLEHIVSVTRAATITGLVTHPDILANFSTPNSRISYVVDGRIHLGDPALYAMMLRENPYAKEVLTAYALALNQLVADVENDDTSSFVRTMTQNKDALGNDFIAESTEKSNEMLKSVKNEKE